jgi:hypothetical protein
MLIKVGNWFINTDKIIYAGRDQTNLNSFDLWFDNGNGTSALVFHGDEALTIENFLLSNAQILA